MEIEVYLSNGPELSLMDNNYFNALSDQVSHRSLKKLILLFRSENDLQHDQNELSTNKLNILIQVINQVKRLVDFYKYNKTVFWKCKTKGH